MKRFFQRFFGRQNPELVPCYDFATKTLTRIPKAELSPGMMLVRIQGQAELVYADSSQLKMGNYQHDSLPDDLVAEITTLATDLADVYPQTPVEWEDGFRRDQNPAREVAGWLHLSAILKVMTGRFSFNPEERKECFRVLVACFTGTRDTVRDRSDPKLLSPAQVDQVIAYFYDGGYD